MKKFLLLFLGACLLVPTAKAYTLDEIFGGKTEIALLQTRQYNPTYEYSIASRSPYNIELKYYGSCGATMKRVSGSNTDVIISGVCFTNYAPEITYSFRFTLQNNGTQFKMGKNVTSVEDSRVKLQDIKFTTGGRSYQTTNNDLLVNITKNTDGTFHFESANGVLFYYPYSQSSYEFVTASLAFDPYEANMIVNEEFEHWILTNFSSASAQYDYTSHRSYPVGVDMNFNTNVCTIKNFANLGYMINNSSKTNSGHLTGKINQAKKTITFDEVPGYIQVYKYSSNQWMMMSSLYVMPYKLCTWIDNPTKYAVDVYKGATAKYDFGEGIRHNDAAHAWVSNGGNRRTWGSNVIYFEDPVMFFNNTPGGAATSGTFDYAFGEGFDGWAFGHNMPRACGAYKNMLMGDDVTLDVELELNAVQWHGDDGVYMVGNIKTNKNDQYVDHYDVMIVRGEWDHIGQTHAVHGTFQPCPDNGHVNARVLCNHRGDATNGWGKQNVISLANDEYQNEGAGEHDYEFAKLIRPEDLGAENLGSDGKVPDGKYTAFIRAIYKPETGLTPTFHSMQYVTVPVQTGVSDLAAEGMAPTVVAVPEGIAISGTDRTVQVVNTLGAVLYQGSATTVNVAPGMYIVRAGSYSTKVLVK